ncbi:ATP-dependent DNA helicase sgs1 [Mortierella sp. AD011]|nr:ATP-dependent DNA helicase sgs1 [Mortierella sp. AD011]
MAMRHRYPETSYWALKFLLVDVTKTIVYFQIRNKGQWALGYLQREAPPDIRDKIAAYHSVKTEKKKKQVMEAFRTGHVRILLSTKAAGMGCDIADIIRFIQCGLPDNLSKPVQRIGRASWNPNLQGHGILLIRQYLGKSNPNKDLLKYIETKEYCRAILNLKFDNKQIKVEENCCDLRSVDNLEASVNKHPPRAARRRVKLLPENDLRYIKGQILDWRLDIFNSSFANRGAIYTVDHVMDMKQVDGLENKCTLIDERGSVPSIIEWEPLRQKHSLALGKILLDAMEYLNKRITLEHSKNTIDPADSKTSGSSSNAQPNDSYG